MLLVSKTPTDSQLIGIVQRNDEIEIATGRYYANGGVSERVGSNYYHAIVNVQIGDYGVPIFCEYIQAVWRNGVEIWRRGNVPVQLEMFV